jgi:hypothetical protein
MQDIIVDLRIGKQEWLRMYRGESKLVLAVSRDGRSVQFPANILSPFTSHEGVYGSFRISFDLNGKFQSIEKI